MTKAERLREHARLCELRAQALTDRMPIDVNAEQARNIVAFTAFVLLELAVIEDEVLEAGE